AHGRIMATVVEASDNQFPTTPWGFLPPRMRTLFVAGTQRTGGWLADALAADSATEVLLEESVGMADGLACLHEESFDAVLISHEEPDLDSLELLDGLRAGGGEEQPVVVLGTLSEQEMSALCFEAGADAYVCINTTTVRSLIWTVSRAIERRRLVAENRRLQQAESHRKKLEHDEAERLLAQQRAMLLGTVPVECGDDVMNDRSQVNPLARVVPLPKPLAESLSGRYRELLRTYVIMGSGNLAEEMRQLVELLASSQVTAHQAVLLHLDVLGEMIEGLGHRSARHVMNRADILVLEMMVCLVEGYRTRLWEQLHPPQQQQLPGFGHEMELSSGQR
ncbi:MAG: response regulator, partial [Pirellulaceae bacterium]|nr:response regulator [Pirellulaceae bacterium]